MSGDAERLGVRMWLGWKGEDVGESGIREYVNGCTSKTATFIPFSASKSTICLPIPSLPPVTTATSFSNS
jgi:hypothetical protein